MIIIHGASNASHDETPLCAHRSTVNSGHAGPSACLSPQEKVINLSLPKSNLLIRGPANQALDTLLLNTSLTLLV